MIDSRVSERDAISKLRLNLQEEAYADIHSAYFSLPMFVLCVWFTRIRNSMASRLCRRCGVAISSPSQSFLQGWSFGGEATQSVAPG